MLYRDARDLLSYRLALPALCHGNGAHSEALRATPFVVLCSPRNGGAGAILSGATWKKLARYVLSISPGTISCASTYLTASHTRPINGPNGPTNGAVDIGR
jgi:hypothetical protein